MKLTPIALTIHAQYHPRPPSVVHMGDCYIKAGGPFGVWREAMKQYHAKR